MYAKLASLMCMQCGSCIASCPSYVATGDPRYSPAGRLSLLRSRTPEDVLCELFSMCSMCKRCAYACPLGIDVAEVTRQVRDALVKCGFVRGRVLPYVARVVENFLRRGNNMGMPQEVVVLALHAIVKKIERERGEAPQVFVCTDSGYVDAYTQQDAGAPRRPALLFPSSSDIFEFEDALKGYIYLLGRLGLDTVVSARVADTANYGYYLSESCMHKIAEMYIEEIERARPALVVFGECGHGWHVFTRLVVPSISRPALHVHQLLHRAVFKGTLKLRRVELAQPVVYMDPCNYSRSCIPLVTEPRALLKELAGRYVEMWRDPKESVCCFGGGGLIAPAMLDIAAKYWRAAYGNLDAGTVVRPCATCKAQLKRVFAVIGARARVTGIAELLYAAAE